MIDDETRMTVRLPSDAAAYLAAEAKANFTSRNAQVVAAIRAAAEVKRAKKAPPEREVAE